MRKVRIVRSDERNYSVQEYRLVEPKKQKGEAEAKPSRWEWVDCGYYGPGQLAWAAKCALLCSCDYGKEVRGEFEQAVASIVQETVKVLK